MENNLPEGWKVENLTEYIDFLPTGVKPFMGKKKYYSTGSIQDEKNVPEGEFTFENKPSRANRLSAKGDVFQARMKATDKGLFIENGLTDSLFSSGFIQVRPKNNNYNNKLLYYFIKSHLFLNQRDEFATGSTQEALTDDKAKQILIPVPPIHEQPFIVEKLEALMAKMENNKARIEKIPKILKRFRQSVLAAAVSGKLTKAKSKWKQSDLISLVGKGGIFDGPFGSNLKTSDYTDSGIRVIRLENIEHLKFIGEKKTFISEEKYLTLKRHSVSEGDIIFSSFIMDEIRVCELPKLTTKAIAKADCFCIRPNEKVINRQFLLLLLASDNSYKQLVLNIHGATRPRINTTQLKKLIVYFPDIPEQQAIIQRVEDLFAFADKIEERFNKVKVRLDKLPQAILGKAFRGELVAKENSVAMAAEPKTNYTRKS